MSAHRIPGPDTPLDLLILADLVPEGAADAPLRARPHRVDAAGFAELLRTAAPTVSIVTGDGEPIALRFDDLRAFRPEALAAALPGLRDLAEVHRILEDLHRGRIDLTKALAELDARAETVPGVKAVREALAGGASPEAKASPEPPPPATPAPPPAEGGLFDLVDVDASVAPVESEAPAKALDRLVREIAGGGVALNRDRLGRLTARLDEASAQGLRDVLHHPAVRNLEAAWRGLDFLLRRIDPRSGVRVHVLAAPAGGRVEAFRELLLPLAAEIREEARTTVALVDADFGGDPDSLAEARALAALAEEARTPLVASADPRLLGLDSWKAIQSLDPVDEMLTTPRPPAGPPSEATPPPGG